jgi:hypothetical protein
MKDFIKEHPYITALIVITLISGFFYTIRFITAMATLKKQIAADAANGTTATTPGTTPKPYSGNILAHPMFTGPMTSQYDKNLTK